MLVDWACHLALHWKNSARNHKAHSRKRACSASKRQSLPHHPGQSANWVILRISGKQGAWRNWSILEHVEHWKEDRRQEWPHCRERILLSLEPSVRRLHLQGHLPGERHAVCIVRY